jgi:hypothetical protein
MLTQAIIGLFLITIVHAVTTFCTYRDVIRTGRMFPIIMMLTAIISQWVWLWLLRTAPDNRTIFVIGVVWDILFTLISLAIPLLFFDVKVSFVGYLGLALIATGALLLKQHGLSQ